MERNVMCEAAIVSTARTGIGKAYRGAFSATEAPVLAAHVISAFIERAAIDPARVDELFWGVGNQWETQGGNAGRMATSAADLLRSVPAFTLGRKCGSGLTAIALAVQCNRQQLHFASARAVQTKRATPPRRSGI
jgi:acetyl-CoA C-acetyltransferase